VPLSQALGSKNSLNALRLALAALVIVSHAWALSDRSQPSFGGTTLGTFAVYGFFAISGYLITRSRHVHSSGSRYLWHRFLRIYPAFWGCLILTAVVFAPIAFAHEHHGLSGFSLSGSAKYVVANSTLSMRRYGIHGTLASVPYPGAWDGSLWTLVYEMACYLAVLVLAAVGLLRREVTAGITAGLVLVLIAVPTHDLARVSILHVLSLQFAIPFGLMFSAGALLYMYADHVPVRWWLALGAAIVTYAGLTYLSGQPVWLVAIPFAYLVMWLGVRLPFSGPSNNHDISYGTYIYAFPVQQLLADFGVARHGVVIFMAATIVPTLVLAGLSRWLIETPVDRFKRWTPPPWTRGAQLRPARAAAE
jgi:peptidoglycan/LPS O-acetylase OafA/YrhL